MTTITADSLQDVLRRRVGDRQAGSVRVVDIEVDPEYRADDERSLTVTVHLSDPTGPTWRLEDTDVIQRLVFEVFADMDVLSAVRFRFAGTRHVVQDEPDDPAPLDE